MKGTLMASGSLPSKYNEFKDKHGMTQREWKEDIKKLKSVQKELHDYFIEYIKSRRGGKLSDQSEKVFSGSFWSSFCTTWCTYHCSMSFDSQHCC